MPIIVPKRVTKNKKLRRTDINNPKIFQTLFTSLVYHNDLNKQNSRALQLIQAGGPGGNRTRYFTMP